MKRRAIIPACVVTFAMLGYAANNAYGQPTAPSDLSAVTVSDTEIALTWKDNSADEDGFRVERKPDGGTYTVVKALGVNATSWNDTGLAEGKRYYYRVYAYKGATGSVYSNEASATTNPSAPTGLGASEITATSVRLVWTDNSTKEDAYRIERKIDGGAYAQVVALNGNSTVWNDFGLSEATTYYYRVFARLGTLNSAYSNEIKVVSLPNAPSGVTATTISTSQIDLAWIDNSTKEDGFKIERKVEGGAFSMIKTVGANIINWSDTSLTDSTLYFYRVYAYKDTTNSIFLNEVNATTIPKAPTSLILAIVSTKQINVSWKDNCTSEEGFKIERKKEGEAYELVKTLGPNTVFNTVYWDDATLTDSTKYSYRVYAFKGIEKSDYSNEASGITRPNSPTNLIATTASTTRINLFWADNSTAEDGFKIERKKEGESFALLKTLVSNVTTWSDDNLTKGTKYFYRVYAFKDPEKSEFSNEANATTSSETPTGELDPPSGLVAVTASPNQINLSWKDNSTAEDGFKIERKKDGGTYTPVKTVGANIAIWTDTGLMEGTKYFYQVYAFKGAAQSGYSNEANAITKIFSPTNLVANELSADQITLSWIDNSAAEEGYKIERKPDGGNYAVVKTLGPNAIYWNDTGLTEGTKYYYRVVAYKGTVQSDYSNETSATTKPKAPTELKVENLTPTSLRLKWKDNSTVEDGYKVERNGVIVATLPANTTTWDEANLTVGVLYTYKVYAYKGSVFSDSSNVASGTSTAVVEQWPLAGSHVVGYTYGEYYDNYDAATDYHWGVDFMGTAVTTSVFAPFDCVINRVFGATVDNMAVELQVGNEYVILGHMMDLRVSSPNDNRRAIQKGFLLGKVGPGNNFGNYGSHVHIDRMTTPFSASATDRRHFLMMYVRNDFRDPTGAVPAVLDRTQPVVLDTDPERIQFKREGGSYFTDKDKTSATPPPGQPANVFIIDGKVDIVAEAQDPMGHTVKPAALFKIGYWVEAKVPKSHDIRDAGTPYILHECSPTLYDGATQKTADIYETGKSTRYNFNNHDTCGHWVVTNTKGTTGAMSDVQADRHWHTKAKNVAGGEPNGYGKGDATGAHNAYFQDGHYIVHIVAFDLVHKIEVAESVWVDNFPPQIMEIDIWEDSDSDPSSGDAPHRGFERQIYSYRYVSLGDGTGIYPAKTGVDYLKDAQKSIAGSGPWGRLVWIRLVFSEAMDISWADRKLQLDPQGKNSGEAPIDADQITWTKTYVENDTLTGIVTIPPKKHATMDSKGDLGSGDYGKDADIVVIARDLVKKTLDANSDGTGDAEDRNHKIKIDTKHDVKPAQKPPLKMEKK